HFCPSCAVTRGLEDRSGDLVLLNDFTLFPSPLGGLALDVAGFARTANFSAIAPASLQVNVFTDGEAAAQPLTVPGGARLCDPQSDLLFTLPGSVTILKRQDATSASGPVTFVASHAASDQKISVPAGTRLQDIRGRIYVVANTSEIPAPELRASQGSATFY